MFKETNGMHVHYSLTVKEEEMELMSSFLGSKLGLSERRITLQSAGKINAPSCQTIACSFQKERKQRALESSYLHL
jgi:hypothetical protein